MRRTDAETILAVSAAVQNCLTPHTMQPNPAAVIVARLYVPGCEVLDAGRDTGTGGTAPDEVIRPPDFEAFWQATMAEAEKVPLESFDGAGGDALNAGGRCLRDSLRQSR